MQHLDEDKMQEMLEIEAASKTKINTILASGENDEEMQKQLRAEEAAMHKKCA